MRQCYRLYQHKSYIRFGFPRDCMICTSTNHTIAGKTEAIAHLSSHFPHRRARCDNLWQFRSCSARNSLYQPIRIAQSINIETEFQSIVIVANSQFSVQHPCQPVSLMQENCRGGFLSKVLEPQEFGQTRCSAQYCVVIRRDRPQPLCHRWTARIVGLTPLPSWYTVGMS